MAYENEISQEFIKKRMLDSVTADIDKREGSFTYDSLSPVANEVSLIYFQLQRILEKCFVDTSYGTSLDKRAKEFGLTRKEGTIATGQVTFTGGTGVSIPKGSIVRTADGLKYTTNNDVIINSTVTVDITATAIGEQYNIPANTIIETDAKGNITYVTNLTAVTGGTDTESDEIFRARVLQKMQNPPGSGNKADYERWAKEIDGVYYAKVIPLWNGPGTVKVVIGGENGEPVLANTVTNVQNYIDPNQTGNGDGKAPVGATVVVANVTPININVEITGLTIETGYSLVTVKTNIKTALDNLMNKLNPGQTVRYNEIISTIIDADGVGDFTQVKVNNAVGNVVITDEQKSITGTISYV